MFNNCEIRLWKLADICGTVISSHRGRPAGIISMLNHFHICYVHVLVFNVRPALCWESLEITFLLFDAQMTPVLLWLSSLCRLFPNFLVLHPRHCTLYCDNFLLVYRTFAVFTVGTSISLARAIMLSVIYTQGISPPRLRAQHNGQAVISN